MSGTWIVWLDRADAPDSARLGGKAYPLARLHQAGFPVPRGFCLTTEAYDLFATANGVGVSTDPGQIRDRLEQGEYPPALRRAIIEAWREFDGTPVAVRSSATAEDRADASFAGQQATFLNVIGEARVFAAIRSCWASLWSEPAVAYRRRQAAPNQEGPLLDGALNDEDGPKMAVIVQLMVPADAAGVAFSRDPVTGAKAVVIEAAAGTGESVVGGMRAVERYRVPETQPVGLGKPGLLNDAQVSWIATTTRALETLFGAPQDVEWARHQDRLWVLQSRPITVLPRSVFTEMVTDEASVWTSGFLNERFPKPVSPLGWSLIRELLEPLAFREPLSYLGYQWPEGEPLIRLYHGHPYVHGRVFEILYKPLPDFLLPEDARRYFPEGDTNRRHQAPYPASRWDWRWLPALLGHFTDDPANWSPFHNHRQWEAFLGEHARTMASLRRDAAALAPDYLDAPVRSWMARAQGLNARLLAIHRWSLMHTDLFYSALRRLLMRWFGREKGAELGARLAAGLENKSLEMNRALAGIRTPVDREAFLAAYGHRSFCLDICQPTLAEQPEVWEGLGNPGGDAAATLAAEANQRLAEAEVRTALSRQGGRWWKERLFDGLLRYVRHYMPLRENQRFHWQQTLALQRRVVLNLGERLRREGRLAVRDDIFFLTWLEVGRTGQGAEPGLKEIAQRQRDFQNLTIQAERAPQGDYPEFLRGNTPWLPAVVDTGGGLWQGTPVSPGRAVGVARVVLSPSQFSRIQPGDILVTRGIDPAWTPIYSRLGGLVMETGGQLSHGAVVAREYGLPAVAGVPGITAAALEGTRVIVDGNAGTVSRLSKGS